MVNQLATLLSIPLTKQMVGWSKWGGAREGLATKESNEWFCQFCGRLQFKGMPCYRIPIDTSLLDFLKACTYCKNVSYKTKTVHTRVLVKITRR